MRTQRTIQWPDAARFCIAVCGLLLIGCKPEVPVRSGDLMAGSEPPPPAPTLSQFNVPIDYDFTPVMQLVERSVPSTFGSLNTVRQMGNDTRRHYAFEATRGPFTAFVVGPAVHLRTTLSYAARGYYKPPIGPTIQAGCGSDNARPKIVVELVTPLTLDSTWHLRSAARLARVEPATKTDADQCKVSVLRYDVTEKVVEAARQGLTSQLANINKKVAQISLAGQATGWWTTLNRPIRLRDDVWLLLRPEQLRIGKITGNRRILTIEAGIDAYPLIVTGAEPSPTTSPLPSLLATAGSSGFNIVIDGQIDYATVSKTLTGVLKGKTITVKGQSVVVQTVTASPKSAGKLTLAVDFTGDAKGTMQLVGAPRFDPALQQIVVPDLDYDIDTNNDLVDVIAWVKSDTLRALLREKARIPVAPVLERGKELLRAGLNRKIGKTLTLAATVDSVTVHGLYVSRGGFVVRAGGYGKAQVSVSQRK